jgi:hypothetical protein
LPITFVTALNIDTARDAIFSSLQNRGEENVFYFHGWHRFGTSAVLRSITEALPSRRAIPQLCFDRTIYIDCSQWKNRRAVHREMAEQLKLDQLVMSSLDKKDEEDDFQGVDESLRNEIDSVGQVIYQTLRGSKCMMIFLNGSDDEVDVSAFGFPLSRFDNNACNYVDIQK